MPSDSRLRVLVLGYVVRCPLGGMAWHYAQYLLGLLALGHDAWYLEDSDDYPSCWHPQRGLGTDPGGGLAFAQDFFARLGAGERWAYHDAHAGHGGHGGGWRGPAAGRARELAASADLLLNVSGLNPLRPWLQQVPVRAFVDTDPVFKQLQHLAEPEARARAAGHTAFFTFGENLARGTSSAVLDGFPWRPTRQPVVLEAWPVTPPAPPGAAYTTVMTWDSYGAREHDGRRFGPKSESLRPYLDLPASTGFPLAVAVGGAGAVLLAEHGWRVEDPLAVSADPWSYQEFVRGSRGELTVAKHGYVAARSGWFSERSAVYLASGRPVVAEDTGFSDWLATGAGLLAFSTPAEALAALGEVEADHARHARAARALAEAHFDARRVLGRLVEDAFSTRSA